MAFLIDFKDSQTRLFNLLVVSIVLLLWVILKVYAAYTSPLRKIPGPFYAPYTNLPLKHAVVTGRRTMHIHALHKSYGPVVRISPTEISIADPDASHTIHRPGSGFVKTEWYARFVNKPVRGIFDMSDLRQHAARRKLLARAFTKSEIRMRWEDMVRSKAELAVRKIRDEMAVMGEADILKWWFFLATDVSGHLMFGESFHTLEEGKKSPYINVLHSAAKCGGITVELPIVGFIGRLLRLPVFLANDSLLDYGKRAVINAKAEGSDTASIFTQLEPTDPMDPSANAITDLDIATEAGNLILAGTDTTAFTITYIFWAVLCRPSIQAALEMEVSTLDENFRDADLEALPFLNAVINETLRLYGAAPGSLPRLVPSGGAHLAGYLIPEGTIVSTQAWTLHRDEKLWPEPEKFDPYRWLTNPPPVASKTAFAPFGAGSRICIGIHLAMMELRMACALFFRQFKGAKLAPATAAQDLEFENFFLIKPKVEKCCVVAA